MTTAVSPNHNGKPVLTATPGRSRLAGRLPPAVPPSGPPANPPGPPKPPALPPAAIGRLSLGIQPRMLMPELDYGFGTTGAKIVGNITDLAKSEFGRLPNAYNWLAIDGAARETDIDREHFMGLAIDGCGTDPRQGYQRFMDAYFRIRYAVDQQVQKLSDYDPLVPVDNSPRDVLAVRIFAGCGGSSAGMLHPMISLVHDVAQQRRIQKLRVYLVLMGADMPLRDSSRTVIREQKLAVPDNCANNLVRVFADITSSAVIQEHRPDGSTFKVPATERVWAPAVIDQSNGQHEWSTTNELVEMIASAYFLQIFTVAGKYVEERDNDNRRLGIMAHGTT